MQLDRFDGVQAQVLGVSVDSTPCLKAWAENLGGISYPLLSDFYPHGDVAQSYGVLRPEGYSERAIFIIDQQGIIRYIDIHDIDDQPDNEVLFHTLTQLFLETDNTQTKAPFRRQALAHQEELAQQAAPEPDAAVVLYCTAWCPDCRRARAFLNERSIPFVEIDITRNREAARSVRGWANGNETTPTVKIHDQVIIGFDQKKLADALGIEV